MARLHDKFKTELIAKLQEELGFGNALAVPRLERIVVSMGVNNAHQDRKKLDEAVGHLATITGQQPKITRAKNSIAGFRLREGM